MEATSYWLIIGFAGQVLFSMRFVVQWLETERKRKSIVPTAFWYFSIAGGIVLLSYAIHKRDPVFIAGQAGGLGIYLRNLYFIVRVGKKTSEPLNATLSAENRR